MQSGSNGWPVLMPPDVLYRGSALGAVPALAVPLHWEVTPRGRRAGAQGSPRARLAALREVALVCAGVLPCLRVRRAGTSSPLSIQPPASGLLVPGELPKTPVMREEWQPVRILLSCLVRGAVLLQHLRGSFLYLFLIFFFFF